MICVTITHIICLIKVKYIVGRMFLMSKIDIEMTEFSSDVVLGIPYNVLVT